MRKETRAHSHKRERDGHGGLPFVGFFLLFQAKLLAPETLMS